MDTYDIDANLPPVSGASCRVRIRETVDIIANKWAVPVILELSGAQEPVRFTGLFRAIPDITQKELTRQLRELEASGLVTRTVHPVVPPRVEYELTELGRSLEPVLIALGRWAALHGDRMAEHRAAATGTTAKGATIAAPAVQSSR